MISWHTHPLVSVLLVLTDPTRRKLAQCALECLDQQTWPLKELVLINATNTTDRYRFKTSGQTIVAQTTTRGVLKNMAKDCARGEWCVWWDETCWFDPDYITLHMSNCAKDRITVADRIAQMGNRTKVVYESRTGLLTGFFRMQPRRYSEDGSELDYIRQFPEKRALDARKHVLKFVRECVSNT